MLVSVTVKAGAKQETVLESDDGYMIYTHTPAQHGRANKRIIELLADHLKIAKSHISIKSGTTYRKKIIEIDDSVLQ